MGKTGWIKIWRKTLENDFCQNDARKLGFWTWCLMKAVTEEKDYPLGNETVHLKPGQFVFGRNKAAHETSISANTIYSWLKQLQVLNMINTHTVNKRYTIVELINWGHYQGQTKSNTHINTQSNTQGLNIIKEGKKNYKKDSLSKEREYKAEGNWIGPEEDEPSRNSYEEWLKAEGEKNDPV